MLLQNKDVAIIGAGPVGLTLARLLQQKGVSVKVYERDEDAQARVWGGTLDLHKNSGQVTLHKAGLLQHYYDLALPMGIHLADENGRIHTTKDPVPGQEHDNPEINRNDLRRMLLKSLAPDTVVWGSKFIALNADNSSWTLKFDNEREAKADLVIGANGGMSAMRHYVTDTAVMETGTFIIQGDVPHPAESCAEMYRLCNGRRLMAAWQGNMIVINPNNGGLLSYGVIFQKPAEWANGAAIDFQDNAQVSAYLCARFAAWADVYRQLFENTSLFVGLPTRVLPLNEPWKSERPLPVTLVGDAAHLMPPFAGQGVNTGLVDARILAESLTEGRFGSITDAILHYEQQMFIYAKAAQKESRENELQMRKPDFTFGAFIQ